MIETVCPPPVIKEILPTAEPQPVIAPDEYAKGALEIIALAINAYTLGAQGAGIEAHMPPPFNLNGNPVYSEQPEGQHSRKMALLAEYRQELDAQSRPEGRLRAALARPWVPSVELFQSPLRVEREGRIHVYRSVAKAVTDRAMGRYNFYQMPPDRWSERAERHHVWSIGQPFKESNVALLGLTSTIGAYENHHETGLRLRERRYALVGQEVFSQVSDIMGESQDANVELAKYVGQLMSADGAEPVAVSYFMARTSTQWRPMLRL